MENLLRKRLALIKARARSLGTYMPGRASVTDVEGPPRTLAEAVPGHEHEIGNDRFYMVRRAGSEIADDAVPVAKRFLDIPDREHWPLTSLILDPGPDMARRIRNREVCFLDIETTGLSPSTYLFLCGLMFVEGSEFVIEQPLARDYSEERGVLLYVRDIMERYPMVVTFNGANFDVPFIDTRLAVAKIARPHAYQHVDLIEPARRAFGDMLGNCRLETVERHLRGFARSGDIAGDEIPDAYHRFVRTGDARDLERILYHNRMDLLAMTYMVNHLADMKTRF